MKRNTTPLVLAVLVALGGLHASGCKQSGDDKVKLPPPPAKTAKASSSATPASAGPTVKAKASSSDGMGDGEDTIRLTGTTAARQQSAVAAEGAGKLAKMLVKEGDLVKKGQAIARLDASMAALRLQQAKAALAMAEVQLKATERERKRLEKLAAEGAVAGQKLDEVTSANEGAQAGVNQAKAAVAMASKALADSTVVAPFAGLVVKRLKAEGEWVSTMPPSPVILLAQIEPLDLTIQAPEHLLKRIQVGDKATAKFTATGQEITAAVTRIVPAVMPPARSFTVIIELSNEDHALEPGVFAEVEITPQSADEAVPDKKGAGSLAASEGEK